MFKKTKIIGLLSLTTCLISSGSISPVASQTQEYPTQIATHLRVTLELKSCAKKANHIVSCSFLISSDEDRRYAINLSNETKMVDAEGNEYNASKVEVLHKVAGFNSYLDFNLVKDSQYKATIDFSEIPDSVHYVTLLQISTGVIGFYGLPQYRNVPFINLDGSISEAPLSTPRRTNPDPSNSNPGNAPLITLPKICLPFIGCTQ